MAGAEQQNDVGGELLVGELVACLLGLHELRGEIGAGLAAAQLEEIVEIDFRGGVVGVGLVELGAVERYRIEQAATGAGAVIEDGAVAFGNAEHVANHRHRQREGEIGDEIHAALVGDAIQHFIDDGLDARAHAAPGAPPAARRRGRNDRGSAGLKTGPPERRQDHRASAPGHPDA